MAERKKTKGEANVLASLPSTRPSRLGRRRDGETPAKAAAKPRAKAKTAAKRKPAARKPPATVTKAVPQRPKPVRPASDNLKEPARKAAGKRAPARGESPGPTELVTTVVQAAGELASVGLSIGGQIVKRAVERLPKP